MSFDYSQASAEELLDHYLEKYRNNNPLAKWLLSNFFKEIGKVIQTLDGSDSILEVGCGPGESSRQILRMLQGQSYEASEYDAGLVELLNRAHFPVTVTQESVYSLNRQDNEFDCVMLLEVLEHLDDYRAGLSEVFRVSKKDVIISVPNEPLWRILNIARGKYLGQFGNTPGHINHWNVRSLVKLIGGFGICIGVETTLPWIVVHARVRG